MSKVEVQNPNIIRIAYHQEESDPNYGSCLWAYYDFDLDKYMLNIQSDCGNASYRWVATPKTESFLHLMGRINDDYLINKLFRETEVDFEETIADVKDWLGVGDDKDFQLDLTEEERKEREEALEDLKDRLSEWGGKISSDAMAHLLDEWNNDYDLDIDCIWERVVTDYTAWEKRIVQIFMDYVQPKIEEILRGEEHGQEEAAPEHRPGGSGAQGQR